MEVLPAVSIHPDKIVTYSLFEGLSPKISDSSQGRFDFGTDLVDENVRISNEKTNQKFLRSARKAKGLVSKHAATKIMRTVEYLLFLSSNQKLSSQYGGRKFFNRVSFITLTLSSTQIHSDDEIKRKLLNSFLIEIQRYHHVTKYFWRAEKQENGNIHFHILCDRAIWWNDVRNRWNRIQNKLGYVDRYRENMKAFFADGFRMSGNKRDKRTRNQQLKAYYRNIETDYSNPNSIDVHGLKKIHNVKRYVAKYVVKNVENVEQLSEDDRKKLLVEGRIWACSENLSNLKGCQMLIDQHMEQELIQIAENKNYYHYSDSYFQVHYIRIEDLIMLNCFFLFNYFMEFAQKKWNYIYQFKSQMA